MEAELAKWKQDYRDLALAIARREGYPAQGGTVAATSTGGLSPGVVIPVEPALPPTILAAIEDTTAPFSEARTMAIEAARGLLEGGAQPEEVEAQLRKGEEIAV